MIVCPNCSHQNPDGAAQCEACYTPLPEMTNCPNCGALVQTDAHFCGQCGFNLRANQQTAESNKPPEAVWAASDLADLSEPLSSGTLVQPDPLLSIPTSADIEGTDMELPTDTQSAIPMPAHPSKLSLHDLTAAEPPSTTAALSSPQTKLQQEQAGLRHVRSNTVIQISPGLSVIHIGKPNDRIPPDIDISGFPDSEIVSRIHADIRVEAGAYYIEDVGSSNGTYINNIPLPMGNRHRLRPGDRISLGKGDRVTFLFQLE